MNPDLLDLDFPIGDVPDLSGRPRSSEETDRWQAENRLLRRMRGEDTRGFLPATQPFTIEDWPVAPRATSNQSR